jgi:hypothetical protein
VAADAITQHGEVAATFDLLSCHAIRNDRINWVRYRRAPPEKRNRDANSFGGPLIDVLSELQMLSLEFAVSSMFSVEASAFRSEQPLRRALSGSALRAARAHRRSTTQHISSLCRILP